MLYQRIDVCKRLAGDNEVVVYRCLHLLSGGGFVVQSADRVRLPLTESELGGHEARFWELFCEEAPEQRSGSFSTLEEAIRNFDEEFENRGN